MTQHADLHIRPATTGDLPAINAIFNHYVAHSTCTYQLTARTLADRQAWFAQHGAGHPAIVAVLAGEVAGWGSLSPFRSGEAYAHTVEDSVYVHPDRQRQGIGSRLLAELIARATAIGHHTIIAGIDREQTGSMALHARHGFVEAGHLHQVGFKFGRWLDVVFMEKTIDCRL